MNERIIVLAGDIISLVVPEKQDVDLWYKARNNLNIIQSFRQLYYKEDGESFYDNLKNDKDSIVFSIYLNSEKKVIGIISLKQIDRLSRNAELGITIFEENNLGKGYGTNSIKLILDYAFNFIGLNKVYLGYYSFNERGKKSYEKVGFKEVGRLKKHYYFMGEYYDDVYMEIFKEEFKK